MARDIKTVTKLPGGGTRTTWKRKAVKNKTTELDDLLKKPISEMTPKEYKRFIALAKIGMIAVVDEVTGYQEARGKKDLRKTFRKLKK